MFAGAQAGAAESPARVAQDEIEEIVVVAARTGSRIKR